MVQAVYQTKVAPVEITSQPGAMIARVICDQCGGKEEWRIAKLPEPDIVQRHFKVRGWIIKRRATCPECNAKKEKPMATVTRIEPKPAAPVANSDAARKNKRLVIVALEDYFDEAARRYRDGRTDEAVAKELDLAPGFVAMVREEFYGKLAEPDEIADLRERIASVTTLCTELHKRLDALIVKNGWN